MAGQVVDVGAPWADGATPLRVVVASCPIIFQFEVAFRPDFVLGRLSFAGHRRIDFAFRLDFALGRFAVALRPDFALGPNKVDIGRRFTGEIGRRIAVENDGETKAKIEPRHRWKGKRR